MIKEKEFHFLEDGYYVEKLEQEIERLNNKIKEQNLLLIEFQDMEQRLKEKDNIIDEAIERLTLNGDIQEKDVIEVFANAIRDTRNILGGDE